MREDSGPLGNVQFGKRDAKSRIVALVFGKGLTKKNAVVEGVDMNLFSIALFTRELELTVVFSRNFMDVMLENRMVTRGLYCEELRMYTFDILELLTLPDPRVEFIPGASTLVSALPSATRPPHPYDEITPLRLAGEQNGRGIADSGHGGRKGVAPIPGKVEHDIETGTEQQLNAELNLAARAQLKTKSNVGAEQ